MTMCSVAGLVVGANHVDYGATKAGALALHEGTRCSGHVLYRLSLKIPTELRVELRDLYENGQCIQTTSVHPGWHSTKILSKRLEKNLTSHGVKVDPPTNVSDAIFEHVLSGRSGQLFVPKHYASARSTRFWPVWYQDVKTFLNRLASGFEY